MRVLQVPVDDFKGSFGITPACAGTTLKLEDGDVMVRDYPRVCGYYLSLKTCAICSSGSPPRVRVLLVNNIFDIINLRITPACAGTTLDTFLDSVISGDHPRVCGYYK